ncbi:MAG: hypothetical protein JWO82_1948 [Akkermansiaceae bacterium]|nr:hypothetical protein [Akkermansiaceae bacterium]
MLRVVLCWLAASLPGLCDLTFETTRKGVTAAPEGGILKVEFPFKNNGSEAVTISRYDSGCGCLTGRLDGNKTGYEPGESGKVMIEIDSTNLSGVVEKELGIWVKGKTDSPEAILKVGITVPELIQVEPRTLRWNAGEPLVAKSMIVTINSPEAIHVTGTSSDQQNFTRTVKVIEDGRKYEIAITPRDASQIGASAYRIETDCRIERLKTKVAFLAISGSPSK